MRVSIGEDAQADTAVLHVIEQASEPTMITRAAVPALHHHRPVTAPTIPFSATLPGPWATTRRANPTDLRVSWQIAIVDEALTEVC